MNYEDNQVLYSFARGKGEEIQMALKKHKDKYYIDLRHWFQAKHEEQFWPTKRGVHFPIESFPELRRGIERLAKAIERVEKNQPIEI